MSTMSKCGRWRVRFTSEVSQYILYKCLEDESCSNQNILIPTVIFSWINHLNKFFKKYLEVFFVKVAAKKLNQKSKIVTGDEKLEEQEEYDYV